MTKTTCDFAVKHCSIKLYTEALYYANMANVFEISAMFNSSIYNKVFERRFQHCQFGLPVMAKDEYEVKLYWHREALI